MHSRMTERFVAMAASFALLVAALGWGVYALTRPGEAVDTRASLAVSDALNMGDSGFELVTGPRRFAFPEDHGPHPEYALEWWYYTGNLRDAEGRRFGYELTFFRRGIGNAEPGRTSEWAAEDIYFAHFAFTDVESDEFLRFRAIQQGRSRPGRSGWFAVQGVDRGLVRRWDAAHAPEGKRGRRRNQSRAEQRQGDRTAWRRRVRA